MDNKSTVYNLFATAEDIREVLRAVEASHPLQYVASGLFDEPERPIFHGFLSLPQIGTAQAGDSNLESTYVAFLQGDELTVRTVPQRRGGTKYAVDQLANPGTVVIRPGGKYRDSALIAGMVGTVHHDEKAQVLIKAFSDALQRFTRIKSYVVGPEARKLYDLGVRLTKSFDAPKEFDLSA